MSLIFIAAEAIATGGSDSWFFKTYPEFLNLNPSHVIFMMVPFWVTVVSTWFLAIKPILHVLEERESRTQGARTEAAELEVRFNEKLKAYEDRLNATKQKALDERMAIRKIAIEEEGKILGAAHDASSAEVEKVRKEVDAERTRVRSELGATAELLARELAEKALGREITGSAGAARAGVRS